MAYFQAILVFGIGSNSGADSSDSNQNEPELEPHNLVAPKEPKFDSDGDSKAGITPALVCGTPTPGVRWGQKSRSFGVRSRFLSGVP